MDVRSFTNQLKDELQRLKDGGATTIDLDILINSLSNIDFPPEPGREPSAAELEHLKAALAKGVEGYKYLTASQLEESKAIIQMGQTAIRFMILINGGAAIAILALLGNLARLDGVAVQKYAFCLLPFVGGTLMGGLVSGFTYLSQLSLSSPKRKVQIVGFVLQGICITLGMLSFGAFALGSWWTFEAFRYIPIEASSLAAMLQ